MQCRESPGRREEPSGGRRHGPGACGGVRLVVLSGPFLPGALGSTGRDAARRRRPGTAGGRLGRLRPGVGLRPVPGRGLVGCGRAPCGVGSVGLRRERCGTGRRVRRSLPTARCGSLVGSVTLLGRGGGRLRSGCGCCGGCGSRLGSVGCGSGLRAGSGAGRGVFRSVRSGGVLVVRDALPAVRVGQRSLRAFWFFHGRTATAVDRAHASFLPDIWCLPSASAFRVRTR